MHVVVHDLQGEARLVVRPLAGISRASTPHVLVLVVLRRPRSHVLALVCCPVMLKLRQIFTSVLVRRIESDQTLVVSNAVEGCRFGNSNLF